MRRDDRPSAAEERLPDVEIDPMVDLAALRLDVQLVAVDADLDHAIVEDFLVAVNEVATESITRNQPVAVRLWASPGRLIAELIEARDRTTSVGPIGTRRRARLPIPTGLAMAEWLCDDIVVRRTARGRSVQMSMER